MSIAIYSTGHEIADTVAEALCAGMKNTRAYHIGGRSPLPFADVHIGYGILRGTGDVFKGCESIGQPWFNVDRGYFNPGHYDGYYRISYRGTQAKWHDGIPRKPWAAKLEAWRWDANKPILVCPPTKAVTDFFGVRDWIERLPPLSGTLDLRVREKGDTTPLDLDGYRAVITFNSSVGWQALQRGIPVISDPHHSIIGSHFSHHGIHSLTDFSRNMRDTRIELFEAMNAHQFTLDEIKRGEAWELITHYLQSHTKSTSATTAASQSAPMFVPTR